MVCHSCSALATKCGWFISGSERIQRYRCKQCGKTFGDIPERPLGDLRTSVEDGARVVHLLCEGVGIRACERLTGLHRDTVLSILETVGAKCKRLTDLRVRNIQAREIQVDEMHTFVLARQRKAAERTNDVGDQYVFLALTDKKLIVAHSIGKRDGYNAHDIMHQIRNRVVSSFQITTDGFHSYKFAVPGAFADEHTVHFAMLQKTYTTQVYFSQGNMRVVRSLPYASSRCTSVKKIPIMGSPEPDKISTSHIERQNLSMRLFNRRLGRLTMNWSKKLANLKHSVALQVAFHNFCRVHRTLGETPAMAAGLTDHKWTIQELLEQ